MGQFPSGLTTEPVLLVIHPFLPAYRRPFFDMLQVRLGQQGWGFAVADSDAPPAIAARGDTSRGDWVVETPTRWLHMAGRDVAVRKVPRHIGTRSVTHVIVQQELRNLETYPLLARSAFGDPSLAMWGQGRAYSTRQGPAASALKQWLTRRSDWFFAYTQAGADYVTAHGFPRARISVLNNTIDTESLTADLAQVTTDDVDSFQRNHGLTPGRTALFLGGVDAAKGIDLLLESARLAAEALPGFVLLVGGAGADLPKVQSAQAAGGPVRALGRLDGADKALALRAADALAIPEWIGLVAVDSLVAGRPIVSTWHPSHSPEHEYLQPGITAVFAEHDPGAYARGLVDLLTAPEMLGVMQARCIEDSAQYSLDHMVESFVEGVRAWDEVRRKGL